ncbi:hypothetical protein DFH08DRAFT_1073313 [Mycena albidolilacea]|uniref:Uncharacterized protein n=1 Tax=Mycena albidolilacea TaxID=1033008 RepID=A0AAD7AQ97_9AGAR|nr:hypothetical protein DFH08DRAFT_1073313 [Mycena albidolilacea]
MLVQLHWGLMYGALVELLAQSSALLRQDEDSRIRSTDASKDAVDVACVLPPPGLKRLKQLNHTRPSCCPHPPPRRRYTCLGTCRMTPTPVCARLAGLKRLKTTRLPSILSSPLLLARSTPLSTMGASKHSRVPGTFPRNRKSLTSPAVFVCLQAALLLASAMAFFARPMYPLRGSLKSPAGARLVVLYSPHRTACEPMLEGPIQDPIRPPGLPVVALEYRESRTPPYHF